MNNQSPLRWRRVDLKAVVPERKTQGAAGYDLAPIVGRVIGSGETVRLSTGLSVAIPDGFAGFIKPRSSAFFKGLDLDGTVDSDFRGEVLLQVRNTTQTAIYISPGERIAQMVLVSIAAYPSQEVDVLDDTERGASGFGSTGK